MSKIKNFLADIADILALNPNVAPQQVLSDQEYKFYMSNKNFIDSYVQQDDC